MNGTLTAGEVYFVRVSSATPTGGNFDLSISVEPTAPTVAPGSIWNDNLNITTVPSGAALYTYYFRPQGAVGNAAANSTNTTANTGLLVAGITYETQVMHRCVQTGSTYNQYFRTPVTTYALPAYAGCASPSPLTTSNVGNNSITISWPEQTGRYTNNGALSGYILYYRVVGTTGYNYVSNLVPSACTGGICSATLTGFAPGTTYDIWIAVRCSPTAIMKSNTVTVTTTGPAAANRAINPEQDVYTFVSGEWEYQGVNLTQDWNNFGAVLPVDRDVYLDVSTGVLRLLDVQNGTVIGGSSANADGFDFNLMPNPATLMTAVTILTKDKTNAEISLYDIEGNLIQQHNLKDAVNGSRFELNTSALAAGIYMVTVRTSDNHITRKLIKM
jgi:hypothetical protein